MDEKIRELKRTIEENNVSLRDAQDALVHHLRQLSRLGATLEDDVCAVLRKVLVQAQARQEIESINERISALCPF